MKEHSFLGMGVGFGGVGGLGVVLGFKLKKLYFLLEKL